MVDFSKRKPIEKKYGLTLFEVRNKIKKYT